jgi:hypothetical protein
MNSDLIWLSSPVPPNGKMGWMDSLLKKNRSHLLFKVFESAHFLPAFDNMGDGGVAQFMDHCVEESIALMEGKVLYACSNLIL